MSHRLSGLPANLLVAIFILFFLTIFTFTLVFVRIVVPGHRLTTSFRVAYNIINTVLATILARFASGEIQKQWLRLINHEISDAKYIIHHNPQILERWRAVLGIHTFPERIKSFRSTALPQLSFLFTALITAAVVAALTLTDTTCHMILTPPRIHSGSDNKCTRYMPSNQTERLSPLWEFRTFWNHDDGSAYFATTNLGCPSWSGAQFMGSINTINPKHVAYSRNGVGIQSTAIGAPEIFYTNLPTLKEPTASSYYIDLSNLRNVSHCLPVMAMNPIKCRPGGSVSFKSNISQEDSGDMPNDQAVYHTLTVEAGGCNYTEADALDPNRPFGAMVSRLCPTPNSVGQATIAMAASGIISLTLAASIGDRDFLDKHAGNYEGMRNGTVKNVTYALSCEIDVQPTIRWRTLTLELKQGNFSSSPSFSKVISGVDGCEAATQKQANWTLGYGYAGGAVAALVVPLSEGRYWNGMTNAIFNQALNISDTSDRYSTADSWKRLIRNPPYGFSQSTNALEDVLGLTAGITMSQMSTVDSMQNKTPLEDSVVFRPAAMGQATFACTRVGSGNKTALLFTLPALLAMCMALWLLFKVPRMPTKFKSSRIDDLIKIGMTSERELSIAYHVDQARTSGVHEVLIREGNTRVSTPESPDNGEKVFGLHEMRAIHHKDYV